MTDQPMTLLGPTGNPLPIPYQEPETRSLEPDILGITTDSFDDYIVALEKRSARLDMLRKIALTKMDAHCWDAIEGKPYCNIAGADVAARRAIVSMQLPQDPHTHQPATGQKEWSEDSRGRFYMYKVAGLFRLPGNLDQRWEVGYCSQRDPFFSKSKGEDKDSALIDEGSVWKAAFTNCFVRGVTAILGFRGITWEELETFGVHRDQVRSTDYARKDESGAVRAITEPQGRLLFARCKDARIPVETFQAEFKVAALKDLPSNRMNEALKWITDHTVQEAAAAQAEGKIAPNDALWIRKGLEFVGIPEAEFVAAFGAKPEDLPRAKTAAAKDWLNARTK